MEAIEKNAPAVVLRHEMKIDSAGPGHFRGGAAVLRDTVWKLDAGHSLTSLRYKNAIPRSVNCGTEHSGSRRCSVVER
ncbi:hydantoinase B/oxoprolinase family protein [Gordonia aichiensis]|uniref:hydantoinase B/oxoprolinase family protein n=1 Tax=Gordonia aichiensis TaxID=36820 RepID=UPI0012FB2EC2